MENIDFESLTDQVLILQSPNIKKIYRAVLYDDSISVSGPINEIVSLSMKVKEIVSDDIDIWLFDKDNHYSVMVKKETSYREIIQIFPSF